MEKNLKLRRVNRAPKNPHTKEKTHKVGKVYQCAMWEKNIRLKEYLQSHPRLQKEKKHLMDIWNVGKDWGEGTSYSTSKNLHPERGLKTVQIVGEHSK